MLSTEKFIFFTFLALMLLNLLSTFVYMVGLQQTKAAIRKAFKARQ